MKSVHKFAVSLLGISLMFAAMLATIFFTFGQIMETSDARQNTYIQLNAAVDLLSDMTDAETSQRGYLITDNESFLEPYLLAKDGVLEKLHKLQQNTSIGAAQIPLKALTPLIEAKLAELSNVIELNRHNDKKTAVNLVRTGVGKRSMDSIRTEIDNFIEIERGALVQRSAAFQSTLTRLFILLVTTSICALIFAIWFAFLIYREMQNRQANVVHAETKRFVAALEKKNIELEAAKVLAETASNAKSDFLSNISHELRTPLNAILGFAQLMETDSPPPTALQLLSIKHILMAGWHLLALVNEILDLAQIESGKFVMSKEPVALDEVLRDCRDLIEPQAKKYGVRLTFPEVKGPCFVSADRIRIKQCLINLLSNAIKYNRVGGDVAVECSIRTRGSIRISISDTGEGLSQEQLVQLFQPFNRLGKTSGDEEGTGIGLALTKRLVELIGGTIGAESTAGVGSVFWIELALTDAPQLNLQAIDLAAQVPTPHQEARPQRTVLYVEDNPANLKLVELLMARRPDLCLFCEVTGELGIEFARANLPEVILMDINLPDISGVEALKILRADPSTADIPVIAISANAMPDQVNQAIRAGFFQYLTKPIKVDEFMATLDAALNYQKAKARL